MLAGLTATEAAERTRRGEINRPPRTGTRDYLAILARNLFTGFNAMVAPAAIALALLRDVRGALAVSGMAILNTGLSLVQEFRAKRHLDRLSLLAESRTRVLRDGVLVELASGDVVRGDCVHLTAGDTVIADGPVLEETALEVDEALLTGESDPLRRRPGEPLLSGSVCTAGEGYYQADAVGAAAFANRVSAEARRFRLLSSPATHAINRIVAGLSYAAIALCILHLAGWHWLAVSERDAIRRVAATITTMVPQGLVLSATIAFLVGAIAMGRRGVLVQRLSAVETMAGIDVICTDKTGTLTTNHLTVERIEHLAGTLDDARRDLQLFASASIDQANRNIAALRHALGDAETNVIEQAPFKSKNRFSAVRLKTDAGLRLLFLGAPETLASHLEPPLAVDVEALQRRGLRILVFAEANGDAALGETLPALRPIAIVAFADELRPEAASTLAELARQGIEFKVVSGDNPETVRATVESLGERRGLSSPEISNHCRFPEGINPSARPLVTGDIWRQSTDRDRLAREAGVFGRMAPHEKVELIETLTQSGRHVAMIGDGVNDVLAIKRAELGIAMGSGSPASKAVAGLVLEGDRFDRLPETLDEGRSILRSIQQTAKLFLTKNVYAFVLIIAAYLGLGIPFPFVPQQVTLLNWSVIGIPALAIAASRQRTSRPLCGSVLAGPVWFSVRTGLVLGVLGVVLLCHMMQRTPTDPDRARTIFLTMLILSGITTLQRALSDGDRASRRFLLLGVLSVPMLLAAMYVPLLAGFFEMSPLGLADWLWAITYALAAWGLTLASDRIAGS
jgi:cation-transporting P-type ATPase E